MKKFWAKILIPIIVLGIFLTPLSPSINIENKIPTLQVETQIASAQNWWEYAIPGWSQYLAIKKVSSLLKGNDYGCGVTTLLTNCMVAFLEMIVFRPLAFIARLAAGILDFFLFYSIQGATYANRFVDQAWGAVRDIANIFFIIALLYVAIKTILGLNVSDNKRIISYIVIVALLINFSLFITQVVIDASNVLARIFYHQIEQVNADGAELTPQEGEKSVTVQLVEVFEPQKIFGAVKPKDAIGDYALVLFLLIAMCAVMIYVFLTVALLFVARVISLWIAMIFSPLAFASYTIPIQIPGFGYRDWWSNLLKNAFLAAIFIFFMYIITIFGGFLSGIVTYGAPGSGLGESATDKFAHLMNVFIPFFITMGLLLQAKKLSVQFSGSVGETVTNIGKGALVLGGAAVGAAALGGASAGRMLAGRGAAAASRSTGAVERGAFDDKIKKWELEGKKGPKPTWDQHKAEYQLRTGQKIDSNIADKFVGKFGHYINKSQQTVGDVGHAQHEMDELKKKIGKEGISDANLTDTDIKRMQDEFKKSKKGEIEDKIKRGEEGILKDTSGATHKGAEEFRKAQRQILLDKERNDIILNNISKDPNNYHMGSSGRMELTDQALAKADKLVDKKKVDLEVNIKLQEQVKKSFDTVSTQKFSHLRQESSQKVGMGAQLAANAPSGTYDVRNWSQVKSGKNDTLGTKASVALINTVAFAIRTGMKQGLKADYGRGQGDVWKDLGSLIKSSLTSMPSMKIKVEDHGGGGGKDHGGGGDGHGGGGGHH